MATGREMEEEMKKMLFLVEVSRLMIEGWGYDFFPTGTIEAGSLDEARDILVQRVSPGGSYDLVNNWVQDPSTLGGEHTYFRIGEMPGEFRPMPWCSCTKDDCPVFQQGAQPHECSVKGARCWAKLDQPEQKIATVGGLLSFLNRGIENESLILSSPVVILGEIHFTENVNLAVEMKDGKQVLRMEVDI